MSLFSTKWFKLTAKINNKAERHIQTIKKTLRKAVKREEDPYLTLLNLRPSLVQLDHHHLLSTLWAVN